MQLDLTKQQYRYLLDLVYIGNWVMNSTRDNDRITEYDEIASTVFSHCDDLGMKTLIQHRNGTVFASQQFKDGGIHEVIEQHEDTIFYELLAQEFALRDVPNATMTPDAYQEMVERFNHYMDEFSSHGTNHIRLETDE